MIEIIVYMARCLIMLLATWTAVRIVGKKTIAQMTSYELAGILLLTTAAAEPLVFKVPSKATVGAFTVALGTIAIGWLSLKKGFYNIDSKPGIVVVNGKIDKKVLKDNKMNLPFLLSQLRIKGYSKVSDVEFAIIEPNGNISVIPKSQSRPVKPTDLQLDTKYEGLALPLVIDGEIQYANLKYANLDTNWLNNEIKKGGAEKVEQVFLAELDTQGKLYIDLYSDKNGQNPKNY